MTTQTPRILLVEDEEILAAIIESCLVSQGFEVVLAKDGLAAWERLSGGDSAFDTILSDKQMPRLDGMALLQRIKEHPILSYIPVVLETATDDSESIREGLAKGAYYYLTKPFQPELLIAVVTAAVLQCQEHRSLQKEVQQAERPFAFLESGTFRFSNLDDGRLLANFFAKACPAPERVVMGLQELLVNAVEHGNLDIRYQEKTKLVVEGGWLTEVERRLALPEYRDKWVGVLFERSREEIRFTISDQGNGFDWQRYLDFDPERAFDPHGRGIAMARHISFDRLEYQGNGNTVVAIVNLISN